MYPRTSVFSERTNPFRRVFAKMASTVLLLASIFAVWAIYKVVAGYRRNIALAKKSGLPYYIVREWLQGHSECVLKCILTFFQLLTQSTSYSSSHIRYGFQYGGYCRGDTGKQFPSKYMNLPP